MRNVAKFFLVVVCALPAQAQPTSSLKGKFEVKVAGTLQNSLYGSSPESFFVNALYGKSRYRVGVSAGVRYYVSSRWYTEYRTGFSPERIGYRQQFTNANYLENSLLIGHSAKYTRRLIFEFYTGIRTNLLLGATFKAAQSDNQENAVSFYRRTYMALPVGVGLKTKLADNVCLGLQPFVNRLVCV